MFMPLFLFICFLIMLVSQVILDGNMYVTQCLRRMWSKSVLVLKIGYYSSF